MHIFVSSVSAVFASENWLIRVKFPVLKRQAGKPIRLITARENEDFPMISEGGKINANYRSYRRFAYKN